ncbi:MAG TPA: sulfatase-like hydrolase/transferase, partial [Chitinophagaceae bacterium]|nr:sulfatase-like hydrolase/transferase [Chitinophagaceae bacterium]
RLKSKRELKKAVNNNKENNETIFHLTIKTADEKINEPKFIYAHLMMPHYPYYFDKDGKEMSFEKLTEGNQVNQQAYIEYLQYANKRLLALIDHIQQASVNPPIIILMGDHGFRHFTRPVESKYYFLNLMSVYLPSKNYAAFHDSLSCVNFFRSFLNTEFNQHLPYLKDSTIYLNDD